MNLLCQHLLLIAVNEPGVYGQMLHIAGQLLRCCVGQKIKLIGIKGDLCKGAWDGEKRQLVATNITLK